jgi:thermostable 8-oxoguanine DNA glycosylase
MTPRQSKNLDALVSIYPRLERKVISYDTERDDSPDYAYIERTLDDVGPEAFLREITHVILAASLAFQAVRSIERKLAPHLSYGDPEKTSRERADREAAALEEFGHRRKVAGIFNAFDYVAENGVQEVIDDLREKGPDSLQRFKGIGPKSCHHLAKNLGYRTPMHDRHIDRLVKAAGFDDARELLWRELTERVDAESVSWVEYVFWKYVSALDGKGDILRGLSKA